MQTKGCRRNQEYGDTKQVFPKHKFVWDRILWSEEELRLLPAGARSGVKQSEGSFRSEDL